MRSIIEGAKIHNTPVSVCGEIAGEPIFASILLGLGAQSLSLTPALLPEVKYFVRKMNAGDAKDLVGQLLELEDPVEIFDRMSSFHRATIGLVE